MRGGLRGSRSPRQRVAPAVGFILVALFFPGVAALGQTELPASGKVGTPLPTDWSFMPYAYYTPETGVALGVFTAMVQGVEGSARVQQSLRAGVEYTFKSQKTVWGHYEAQPGSRWMILADVSGKISVPDRLYLPGNRTGRENYEEWTRRGGDGWLKVLRQVGPPSLFVGPMLELQQVEIRKVEEGGLLDQGKVPGSEDHGLVGLGVAGVLDSRDSQIFPRSGSLHSLMLLGYRGFQGDVGGMGRVEGDLRHYRLVRGSAVVALRAKLASAWGEVPFTMNAPLGGTKGGLRGIYETRYTDRSAAVAVAELRFPLFWRVGGVAFGGIGEVAADLSGLALKGVHGTAGGGLRFALIPSSGLNLGVDFAMGEGESGLYFLLGEVF